MIESKAVGARHLPASYSGSEMPYVVDSVDIENPDRSGLVYHLELSCPISWQSSEYEVIAHLSGHERPPISFSGALQYQGWQVYLEEYLDAKLSWPQIDPGGSLIQISTVSVTPYRIKSWAERDGALVAGSEVESTTLHAIKGALGELEAVSYPDFLSTYRDEKMQWLTRKISGVVGGHNTQQVLSYLVNLQPRPSLINVRVSVNYHDGVNERFTAGVLSSVVMWSILHIQCGYGILGLSAREQYRLENEDGAGKAENWYRVHNYDIYLTNQDNEIIAAPFKFTVDPEPVKQEAVLMFSNSLGGVDMVRFTGIKESRHSVSSEIAERRSEQVPAVFSRDLYSVGSQIERKLIIQTGLLGRSELEYLQELGTAEQISLIYDSTGGGMLKYILPLNLEKSEFTQSDAEGVGTRSFEFSLARKASSVNSLSPRPGAAARPTSWIPQGSFCLIDERGLRTGELGASKLKLFYTDVHPFEPVRGVSLKDNVAGTPGYIPPVISSACVAGTAAYYNVAISEPGTFIKKGCAPGYTGTAAIITVPAGMFGGESPQQAAKLARAEWNRRNTQAAADANPSGCVLAPENYVDVASAAGKAWFRFNTLTAPGSYANHAVDKQSGEQFKGNAWWCWGTSLADVYPQGSNDIQLPVNFGTSDYRFTAYGRGDGASQTLTVYVNGIAIASGSGTGDNFYVFVPNDDIQEGDRVYIKVV